MEDVKHLLCTVAVSSKQISIWLASFLVEYSHRDAIEGNKFVTGLRNQRGNLVSGDPDMIYTPSLLTKSCQLKLSESVKTPALRCGEILR